MPTEAATATLRDLTPGAEARVLRLSASLRPEVQRRLRDLGFGPGERVRCLRVAPLGGPRVYSVSVSTFALEAPLAEQVEVKLLGPRDKR